MKKIFIDPGHGGSESGAVNKTALEKDINLSVALRLKQLLLEVGFEVKLSRETDVYIDLQTRCDMANSWGADYFISIHHNACNGKTSGYEVIHSIIHGVGFDMANLIAKEFEAIGQKADSLGVYDKESQTNPGHDYYAVIRGTNAPANITEFGYMDSVDYSKFDTLPELEQEAGAIFRGICHYYDVFPEVSETVSSVDDVIDYLYKIGKIKSPEYWKANAKPGQMCSGEYVGILLQRLVTIS